MHPLAEIGLRAHENNIGILRLALASAVIVGHAPEMLDGNRHREVLHQIAPATSLGEVAVAGFFLLSGFLISASMLKLGSLRSFLERRVLRIVPGYVVAYPLSVFLLALAFDREAITQFKAIAVNFITLHEPPLTLKRLALAYPSANGALWTINIEFKCYLLAALLWGVGVLAKKRVMLTLTAALATLLIITSVPPLHAHFEQLGGLKLFYTFVGPPTPVLTLATTFLVGTCIFLYREEAVQRLNVWVALASLAAFVALQWTPYTATLGQAVFLAPPVFWSAFKPRLGWLRRVNGSWDISYGTYLYGWPIATALILLLRPSPAGLAVLTLPLAWAAGWLSWIAVEKWTKDLVSRPPLLGGGTPLAKVSAQADRSSG